MFLHDGCSVLDRSIVKASPQAVTMSPTRCARAFEGATGGGASRGGWAVEARAIWCVPRGW